MIPKTIKIGYQGQKLVRHVDIDITPLLDDFGTELTPTIVHKRENDTDVYTVSNIAVNGNILTWTFDDVDTAVEGCGMAQIIMSNDTGTVIGKSYIIRTITGKSIPKEEETQESE